MLTCREVSERANEYIDGELEFRTAMQMRMHLVACRYCRSFVEQLRTVARLVREYGYTLPEEEPQSSVSDLVTTGDLVDAFTKLTALPPWPKETRGEVNNIGKGFVAGFAATVVLSVLMLMKAAVGFMPELDVISMLSGMMHSGPALGWLAHFMIGSLLWGGLLTQVEPRLPGESLWLKGIVFATGAWLLMMVTVMPMAGAGFFCVELGMTAPVMTLMLHVIFGAVLGGTYALLQRRDRGVQLAHS